MLPKYCIFLLVECLWQHCVEQIYQHHFFPVIFSHFTSVGHISVILELFQNFHYYYICYGDLGSEIFDVTIAILGGNANCTHVRWQIMKYMCAGCSTDWLFPISHPLLRPSQSLGHNYTEIRLMNNPTMASKYSSEKKSCKSLLSFMYYFSWLHHGMWEFLGQRSNMHHSSDSVRSLTH